MKKILAYTCIVALMASCTLHPDYERPAVETPEDWRTPLSAENAIDISWWKQFGDPILDNLIEQSLLQNQDLKIAIARVDQFQAQLGIARSKYYPQISGGALGERQKIPSSVTALPPGVQPIYNIFGLLGNASYLVDLWGEVRSAVEDAYHQWLASIEARRTVVISVVTSVASTYFQLRQFDQQLLISKQTLQSRNDELYLAQVRFNLGLTSQIEVEQAISEVEDARVEVENFEIEIAETENLLSVFIGKASLSIPRGLALDQTPMIQSVPEYLPSELLNQRPDLRAAENKLIAANARIGVAKAKFFPQLSLSGALGAESIFLNNLFTYPSSLWEYGATLMQEIFTGWRITNDVRYTEAVQREALHQYVGAVLTAFKEVNNALTSHKIYLTQVETQRVRVESLERYLHLSDLRYKEGQIDYLTFLDAERQLFRAQLDYETTKSNSFQSLVQIYQSLGGPWSLAADETLMEN